MPQRRFPPPWTAVEIEGGYRVEDATGQAICYVYGTEDERRQMTADLMSKEQAGVLARNIARLPELLKPE